MILTIFIFLFISIYLIDILECACAYFRCDKLGKECHHWGCFGGCRVNKAPPKGYKCKCRYLGFWTCDGIPEKCSSEDDVGCSGCKEKECCDDSQPVVGDCSAYGRCPQVCAIHPNECPQCPLSSICV